MTVTALVELTPTIDFYTDGVHRIEVSGETARLVFFRWRLNENGVWEKTAAEFARLCPARSLRPLRFIPDDVLIVQAPQSQSVRLHS